MDFGSRRGDKGKTHIDPSVDERRKARGRGVQRYRGVHISTESDSSDYFDPREDYYVGENSPNPTQFRRVQNQRQFEKMAYEQQVVADREMAKQMAASMGTQQMPPHSDQINIDDDDEMNEDDDGGLIVDERSKPPTSRKD